MQIRPEQHEGKRDERWPYWDDPKDERDWDGAYERLAQLIQQVRAISAAQVAVVSYWGGEMGLEVAEHYSQGLSHAAIKTSDEMLMVAQCLRQAAMIARHEADNLALAVNVQQAHEPPQNEQ